MVPRKIRGKKKLRRKTKMGEPQSSSFGDHELTPKEGLVEICDLLEDLWGMGKQHSSFLEDPLEGLVQTILSQNTNDKNRDKAYAKLKLHYPLWKDVAQAKEEELQQIIAVAGLGKVKSRYILQALASVKSHLGEYSLDSMKNRPCQEIRDFLENIPGVGPKTAACVLLFQFHCPAFPVDTHVARVSKRLGIAEKGDDARKIEGIFRSFLPENRFLEVHLNFIMHGRNLCLSRKPRCSSCLLSNRCPSVIS
jgi:endonuclease-3